jgi:hypothetical protein
MISRHGPSSGALALRYVVRREFFRELSAAEDEGDIEEILEASEHAEDAAAYDVARIEADVRSDLALLREMAAEAARVQPDGDPKLAALVEELAAIAKQASDEALDEEEARQKRKVLVFSHYEDTIDWIEERLLRAISVIRASAPTEASVSRAEVRGSRSAGKALHGAPSRPGRSARHRGPLRLLLCTTCSPKG